MIRKLDPALKINLMEALATYPVCIVIGLISGTLANVFAWPATVSLTFTIVLVIIFLATPLAGMLRGYVRRKAESYYYGT